MNKEIKDQWENIRNVSEESKENYIKPLWNLNFEDEKKVLDWWKESRPQLEELSKPHAERFIDNLLFYKGIQSENKTYQDRARINKKMATTKREVVVNVIAELTDTWVNRISQFKPDIVMLPNTAQQSSRQGAKIAQQTIDYSFKKNKIEALVQQFQKQARVYGESYIYTKWNPEKGDLHPDYIAQKKAAMEKAEAANSDDYTDKVTLKVKNEAGEDITVEKAVKVGDVEYKTVNPCRVHFPDVEKYDDALYCVIEEEVELETVQADYPDKDIKYKKGDHVHNNKITVYEIYHKGFRHLENGRYLKIAGDTILANTTHPYNHKDFPLTRLTDEEYDDELRGHSFIEKVKVPQVLFNKITSAQWRNLALAIHPKWFMPQGSAKIQNLGNAATVVQYTGGVPPKLATFNALPPESFSFRGQLREDMEKSSALHGVSFGQPPANIRSGIQFAQLQEQQERAVSYHIIKRNTAIEQLAEMSLSVMADYYDVSDGRLLRIVGKDKEPLIKTLDIAALGENYTVEAKNSNALPEGKFEKLGILSDMRESFGEAVVPNEVVIDAFDIGKVSRYTDYATASVEKAESENEEMLQGEKVPAPEKWDDLILEWKIHVAAMRKRSFSATDAKVKALFEEHVGATEYLMEQASINPAFAQRLATLEGFPIFYQLTPAPAPLQEQMPVDGGAIPEQLPDEAIPEQLPPEGLVA